MTQIYCQQGFKYPQEVLSLCLSSDRTTSSLMPTSSVKWLQSERAPPLALIISSGFLFFPMSCPCGSHLWSDMEMEAVKQRSRQSWWGEENKCGQSLARHRKRSSAWRQGAKPRALLRPIAVYQNWIDAFAQCTTGCGWRGEMRQGNRLRYSLTHYLSTSVCRYRGRLPDDRLWYSLPQSSLQHLVKTEIYVHPAQLNSNREATEHTVK